MTGGRDSHVAMLLRMTRVVFTHWDNSVKDDMVAEYPSTVVFLLALLQKPKLSLRLYNPL